VNEKSDVTDFSRLLVKYSLTTPMGRVFPVERTDTKMNAAEENFRPELQKYSMQI